MGRTHRSRVVRRRPRTRASHPTTPREVLDYYGLKRASVTAHGLRKLKAIYEQGLEEADAIFRMTESERKREMAVIDEMVSATVRAPVGLDKWAFSWRPRK